jgi:hypothetical protein
MNKEDITLAQQMKLLFWIFIGMAFFSVVITVLLKMFM